MPKGVYDTKLTPTAESTVRYRKQGREMRQLIEYAREKSLWALKQMVKLAEGQAGTMRVLDPKSGGVVTIDIEVPASVQQRALEFIVERAFGKAPQAILLDAGETQAKFGPNAIPIVQRILAIQQARDELGSTITLEASEQREIPANGHETIEIASSTPADPRDLI